MRVRANSFLDLPSTDEDTDDDTSVEMDEEDGDDDGHLSNNVGKNEQKSTQDGMYCIPKSPSNTKHQCINICHVECVPVIF